MSLGAVPRVADKLRQNSWTVKFTLKVVIYFQNYMRYQLFDIADLFSIFSAVFTDNSLSIITRTENEQFWRRPVMSIVATTSKSRIGQVEADQIMVVLPNDPRYDDPAVLERLETHMSRRFPAMTFRFVNEGLPREPDRFIAIPVCGIVGEGWRSVADTRLLSPPPLETMGKINRWLRVFDPEVENLVRLS